MAEKSKIQSDILNFLPIKSIKDSEITYITNAKARIIRVGSINLAYLSIEEQNFKINQLANVFRGISNDFSIVKLERPVDLQDNIDKQDKLRKVQSKKLKNKEINDFFYSVRQEQVNIEKRLLKTLHEDNPMLVNDFFIIIYGKNSDDLKYEYENAIVKLNHVKLMPRKLDDNQIKTFLYNFYNPLKRVGRDHFKDIEDYKSEIMPEKMNFSSRKIVTDSMETSIWGVYEYPINVAGGWLSHMMTSSNTTCVVNVKNVSTATAKKIMDKAITEIKTQMYNKSTATQSESQKVQLETFYSIVRDLERGNESLKLINIMVMNYGKDEQELREVRRKTKTTFRQNSFKIDELPFRQQQGLIAMIPTPRDEIIDMNGRDIPSTTMGAAFPFVFQNLDDKDGFLLGYNNSNLIFWDPKVRDPSRTNSNVMVIGKSGSGKSHFTKKMFLKMILEDIKIYIVDPEGEYSKMSEKLGGQKIDVGAGFKSRINPFHIFAEMEEDEATEKDEQAMKENFKSAFSTQIQFLEQFFKNLVPDLTDKEISRLSKLLIETYKKKGILEDTNFKLLKKEEYPIMDDLSNLIEEKIKDFAILVKEDKSRSIDLADEINDLRNLKVYVERMASGGSLASLWNGSTTIETSGSDFIHFDFKRMNTSKNERVMNAQMMLVLRFLESEVSKNRQRNLVRKENRHVAIAVDEAHLFIDERSPAALFFMFQMIKRIRKYNGIFVVITQNVNDFVGSESIKKYTTAIVNGCQYSFIFGLNPADLQALMDLYSSVGGFSEEEKQFIGNAGIGQCLFIVAPGQRITMERILITKDEEKAFV